jgi:hypothetical protein
MTESAWTLGLPYALSSRLSRPAVDLRSYGPFLGILFTRRISLGSKRLFRGREQHAKGYTFCRQSNLRMSLVLQPQSVVLDGCPMFALPVPARRGAYMGRKRSLPMLSPHVEPL